MKEKLQALGQLSNAEPTFGDFHAFFKEVNEEKNERGAAILLAANVENGLRYAIAHFLNVAPDNKLFRSSLRSFEAKTRIGREIEIFGSQMEINLDCIRAIRNAFAHAVKPICFTTPQVRDVCDVLVMPTILPPMSIVAATGEPAGAMPENPSPRIRFQKVCEAVGHNLLVHGWSFALPSRADPKDVAFVTQVRPKPLP